MVQDNITTSNKASNEKHSDVVTSLTILSLFSLVRFPACANQPAGFLPSCPFSATFPVYQRVTTYSLSLSLSPQCFQLFHARGLWHLRNWQGETRVSWSNLQLVAYRDTPKKNYINSPAPHFSRTCSAARCKCYFIAVSKLAHAWVDIHPPPVESPISRASRRNEKSGRTLAHFFSRFLFRARVSCLPKTPELSIQRRGSPSVVYNRTMKKGKIRRRLEWHEAQLETHPGRRLAVAIIHQRFILRFIIRAKPAWWFSRFPVQGARSGEDP